MAAPRDYKSVIDGGGMIRWDWKNNKYVFIDKDHLNKELNKLDAHKPSPYEAHARIRKSSGSRHRSHHRPSYKIQGKHACRPLRQQNSRSRSDKLMSSSGKGKLKVYSPKKQQAVFKKPAILNPQPVKVKDKIVIHNKENVPLVHDGKGDKIDEAKKVGKSHKGSSKTPPRELSSEHATFTSIISSRLIHIKAAKTFWRQSPDAFLSYLVKTEDDAVTVDVLPVVMHHLKNGTSTAELITMGVCLELIPTLRRLLDSKIEDYVKTSLDMLRTILRYWWNDLRRANEMKPGNDMLQSRSIPEIYTSITAMLDKVQSLTKRRGEVSSKAKIVEELLQRL